MKRMSERWRSTVMIKSRMFEIFYPGSTKHVSRVSIVLEQEMGNTIKGYWLVSDHLSLFFAESPIMKEMRAAIRKMKSGPAGPGNILEELLETF